MNYEYRILLVAGQGKRRRSLMLVIGRSTGCIRTWGIVVFSNPVHSPLFQ
jgi:hypothetical protein